MQSIPRFWSSWLPNFATNTLSRGIETYESGNYAKALIEFQTLARQGNASAQAILGCMYHNGEGASVDLQEAARWLRAAAEKGVPDAQFNLGVMYQEGKGVSQSITEALHWYRHAAQWGIAKAQINLSTCFHKGLGVSQDEYLAAWWVSLAADQGDVDAQINLARRYINGSGLAKDAFEAFFWFDLAAKSGSSDAIEYASRVTEELTQDQVTHAQRLNNDRAWKPRSAEDSALQIFKAAASESIGLVQQAFGEERFGELRITDRKAPSIGEVILSETRGIRSSTIGANIKNCLNELDRRLDLNLGTVETAGTKRSVADLTPQTLLGFIRRIDDLADVGTVLGEDASSFTQDLLGYHLALIGALEKRIDSGCLAMLLKRFSLREAVRAPRLRKHSELHNVVLPLLPW